MVETFSQKQQGNLTYHRFKITLPWCWLTLHFILYFTFQIN